MDMRIWHASVNTCVSLRDAAAEQPIMQQRFQAMVAAHSAVAVAARAVREARVWPSAPTVLSLKLLLSGVLLLKCARIILTSQVYLQDCSGITEEPCLLFAEKPLSKTGCACPDCMAEHIYRLLQP